MQKKYFTNISLKNLTRVILIAIIDQQAGKKLREAKGETLLP